MSLKDKQVILASGSPRRINILKEDGVDFQVIKPACEENIHLDLAPHQYCMALALRKALDIGPQTGLIIACDTIVVDGEKVIGKPVDEEDAFNILKELSGKKHQVVSGVCLMQYAPKYTELFYAKTDVYFKKISDAQIREYIITGEPMDKAGAYAIQGAFSKYIDHIDGSYNNVVGFPYEIIKEKINAAGLT